MEDNLAAVRILAGEATRADTIRREIETRSPQTGLRDRLLARLGR